LIVRTARVDELEYLKGRIVGEQVDLNATPVWVAEEDGEIKGLIALRLVWQIEPLQVFEEVQNKSKRRRISRELYRAAASWLSDKDRNATGVYRAFAVTRDAAVLRWAKALGWLEQYVGAKLFIKEF
jgi:hypothetical protein